MPQTRAQATKEVAFPREANIDEPLTFSDITTQDFTLVDSESDSPKKFSVNSGDKVTHLPVSSPLTYVASLDSRIVSTKIKEEATGDSAISAGTEAKKSFVVSLKLREVQGLLYFRRAATGLSARAKRNYTLGSEPFTGSLSNDSNFAVSEPCAKKRKTKKEPVKDNSLETSEKDAASRNVDLQNPATIEKEYRTQISKTDVGNEDKTTQYSSIFSEVRTRSEKRLVLKLRNNPVELSTDEALRPDDDNDTPKTKSPEGPEDNSTVDDSKGLILVSKQELEVRGKRRAWLRPPGGYSNKDSFRFGHSPLGWNNPTVEECEIIFALLQKHHADDPDPKKRIELSRDSEAMLVEKEAIQGPLHAGRGITIDALVKTILSQATANSSAIRTQQLLLEKFHYVDSKGKKVVGTIPNYHAMHKTSTDDLAKVLKQSGLQNLRAGYIKELLDVVQDINLARLTEDQKATVVDGNPPGATDFVPGLLSLDYLNGLKEEGHQVLIDHLMSFRGISLKTAGCVLMFNFEIPFFVVDVHVHRIVKWLGWVPKDCTPNKASAHLDTKIPNDLKYGLHQAFWHHGQLCARCRSGNDPQSKAWKKCVCPIEKYLRRHRERSRKKAVDSTKQEDSARKGSPKSAGQKLKAEPTAIPINKMTPEEAASRGYVWTVFELAMDDNFGTRRGNFGKKRDEFWLKIETSTTDETDGNLSTETNSSVMTFEATNDAIDSESHNATETHRTLQITEAFKTTF